MAKNLWSKPIVERADELLANPTLRLLKNGPRSWQTALEGCDAAVFTPSPAGTVVQPTGQGHIDLSQEIRAYPNRRYRLDVRVVQQGKPASERVAEVQLRFAAFKGSEELSVLEPPAMHVGADAPLLHRATFQCPPGTGKLQIRLRIRATKPIVIPRIRLVETGDYLPEAHPLACPPAPSQEVPPYLPDQVVLCDSRRDDRPLVRWLRHAFGAGRVQRIAATGISRVVQQAQSDRPAIVIDVPAQQAPSLRRLLEWSDNCIVIASLETFASAAQQAGITDIRLQDRVSGLDMPAASVAFAAYHTRGFALADAMPYCWNDGQDDFAHRYLKVPKLAKARLAEKGIHVSLTSETGQSETKNHPVVLYRRSERGALIVMDPDGLEKPSAGEDVPQIFELLWCSALGRDTVTLGQFAAPALHYDGVRVDLVEVAKHFDTIEDLSVPARLHRKGHWPPAWLWPNRRFDRFSQHKTLLIRTGFAPADWPGIYGLILWLKRVALQSRTNHPLARMLLERLRVMAWPISHPQAWPGCPAGVTEPHSGLQPDEMAGSIDVATGDEAHTVILVPDRARVAILQQCLGALWPSETEVVIAPQAFAEEPLSQPAYANQLACKVLLPGIRQAHHAASPALTDLAACLLERLVYAAIGWIVPNRTWREQQVNMTSAARGSKQVLCIDPAGQAQRLGSRKRSPLLPPGHTLVGRVSRS